MSFPMLRPDRVRLRCCPRTLTLYAQRQFSQRSPRTHPTCSSMAATPSTRVLTFLRLRLCLLLRLPRVHLMFLHSYLRPCRVQRALLPRVFLHGPRSLLHRLPASASSWTPCPTTSCRTRPSATPTIQPHGLSIAHTRSSPLQARAQQPKRARLPGSASPIPHPRPTRALAQWPAFRS